LGLAVDTSTERIAEIEAKLAEALDHLETLESGDVHLGGLFSGRTEAKILDLKRQIAEHQSVLDELNAQRP
jgi:uncharacterized coiled-coil protein SlyX